MVLRQTAMALGVSSLKIDEVEQHIKLALAFVAYAAVDHQHVVGLVQNDPKRFRLLPSGKLLISAALESSGDSLQMLKQAGRMLEQLRIRASEGGCNEINIRGYCCCDRIGCGNDKWLSAERSDRAALFCSFVRGGQPRGGQGG